MVNPAGPFQPNAAKPAPVEPAPARPAEGTAPAPRVGDPAAEPGESREATLWDLLTPEERDVYERYSGAGALVYRADGRRGGDPPVATGRRVDLRG